MQATAEAEGLEEMWQERATAHFYLNLHLAGLWEQPGTVEPAVSQVSGDLGSSPNPGCIWTGL